MVDWLISRLALARNTGRPHFLHLVRSLNNNSVYRYRQLTLPLEGNKIIGSATVECHITLLDVSLIRIIDEMDLVADYLVELD